MSSTLLTVETSRSRKHQGGKKFGGYPSCAAFRIGLRREKTGIVDSPILRCLGSSALSALSIRLRGFNFNSTVSLFNHSKLILRNFTNDSKLEKKSESHVLVGWGKSFNDDNTVSKYARLKQNECYLRGGKTTTCIPFPRVSSKWLLRSSTLLSGQPKSDSGNVFFSLTNMNFLNRVSLFEIANGFLSVDIDRKGA